MNKKTHAISENLTKLALDHIIAVMPGHVYWKDSNGIYLGCNNSQARSLGFNSGNDVVGKTDFDITAKKEDAEVFRKNDVEVMESGQTKVVEEIAYVEGKESTVLSHKIPLCDEAGKIIGVLGISLDVSELKKVQKALADQVKKTEQAYHSKTEFIAIASHEIRNPIGNVISMADNIIAKLAETKKALYSDIVEVLNEAGKPELIKNIKQLLGEAEEEIIDAKTQAHRSLNALTNLGNLHHLQTEGVKPKPETSDIHDLFKKVVSQNKLGNDNNIDFYLEINPKVPKEAIIDYRNVQEALGVIVGNAVRFSHPNGLVKIKAEAMEKNSQHYLMITVQDFGVGIAETQLAHVLKTSLDPDERNNETRYRKPSLQLPQAKMKAEASGGELQIKSALDKGTIVTLLVPFQLGSQTAAYQKFKTHENTDAIKPQYILLVEDDLAVQKVEKNYLMELGHKVDVASTGATAIALGIKNNYDMIFIDITLPDMDGIAVMRKIQQARGKKLPRLPFVAITSHASDEDFDRIVSQGVATVLTKPVTKHQLSAIISNLIDVIADEEDDDNVSNAKAE